MKKKPLTTEEAAHGIRRSWVLDIASSLWHERVSLDSNGQEQRSQEQFDQAAKDHAESLLEMVSKKDK